MNIFRQIFFCQISNKQTSHSGHTLKRDDEAVFAYQRRLLVLNFLERTTMIFVSHIWLPEAELWLGCRQCEKFLQF